MRSILSTFMMARHINRLAWCAFILILLLVACQSNQQNSANSFGGIEQVENIEAYLETNIGLSGFGGEVFCDYEPLNAEQGEGDNIYLWAMCLEYYLKQGKLTLGSGISLPVVLQIERINDHYEIVRHLSPGDGSFFGQDVRVSFPKSAWPQIMPESEDDISEYNSRAERLEKKIEEKARYYYDDFSYNGLKAVKPRCLFIGG